MNHESTPHSRRLGRWIVVAGLALSVVLISCVGLWFGLPYFCPDWVIRHSPWLEPVVRTRAYYAAVFNGGIDHPISNPDPWLYRERMESWGPTLAQELAPLLHATPGMRAAALETYPLRVPFARRSPHLRDPKDWEHMTVSMKPIVDEDRVRFLVSVNNTFCEIRGPKPEEYAGIQKLFAAARSQGEYGDHPTIPGRKILKIRIELRIDSQVPFFFIDQLIRIINERCEKAGEQDFAYLEVTTSEGGSLGEAALSTTALPPPPEAQVITLVPHATSTPEAGVDVRVDGRPVVTVDGPLGSSLRHDGIVRAIAQGLAPPPNPGAICVRGGPLTPWADVVAGLDGARIANDPAGAAWSTGGAGGTAAETSLTIAPMVSGKP